MGYVFQCGQKSEHRPSLINMYKELQDDLGIPPATHGFLEHWAQQGVLLLNSVLTVEHKQAASHQGRGWEQFTDRVIAELNEQREHLVFYPLGQPMHRGKDNTSISLSIWC